MERCKEKRAKGGVRGTLGKASSSFGIGLSIMTPIKPMLAKKVTDFEECVTKSPDGMFAEVKYDGERIQIHKDGTEFKCFSRNLKPILEWKVCHTSGSSRAYTQTRANARLHTRTRSSVLATH